MRVGTSNKFCDVLNKIKDHPHACGDKIYITLLRFFDIGSSPCVWGQVFFFGDGNRRKGIIPMRVGTRLELMPRYINAKDHPHACGDKAQSRLITFTSRGSSPCVWGQDSEPWECCGTTGIIPMRVGTRLFADARGPLLRDHPHACGDKFFECLC